MQGCVRIWCTERARLARQLPTPPTSVLTNLSADHVDGLPGALRHRAVVRPDADERPTGASAPTVARAGCARQPEFGGSFTGDHPEDLFPLSGQKSHRERMGSRR